LPPDLSATPTPHAPPPPPSAGTVITTGNIPTTVAVDDVYTIQVAGNMLRKLKVLNSAKPLAVDDVHAIQVKYLVSIRGCPGAGGRDMVE
jgi:hypothetical protein